MTRTVETIGKWFTAVVVGIFCQYLIGMVTGFYVGGLFGWIATGGSLNDPGILSKWMGLSAYILWFCLMLAPSTWVAEWIFGTPLRFGTQPGIVAGLLSWSTFVLILGREMVPGVSGPVLPHPYGWWLSPFAIAGIGLGLWLRFRRKKTTSP